MQPTYYRIAPELRRSAVYVMVGLALVAVVAVYVGRFVAQRGAADMVAQSTIFGAIALAMIIPLRWAVRIDDRGVARRWLRRWDLWPWEDFSSGRLQKRHPFTFVDPLRPWWRRKLRLGFINGAQLKEVIEIVNARYVLSPPPTVPAELEIKYGWRRTAKLDWRGIHLTKGTETLEYLWSDVRRLRITRMEPLRRDFAALELHLPKHVVELRLFRHQGGTSPTWRGATAEEINEFLLARVAPKVVDIDIAGERPSRPADIEKRVKSITKSERELRFMTCLFASILIGLLVWMALAGNVAQSLVMTGLCALQTPVVWWVFKRSRDRRETLQRWLAEHEETSVIDHPVQ